MNGLENAGEFRAFDRGIVSGCVIGQRLRAEHAIIGDGGVGAQLAEFAGAVHGQQGKDHTENHQNGEHKIQNGGCGVRFHRREKSSQFKGKVHCVFQRLLVF